VEKTVGEFTRIGQLWISRLNVLADLEVNMQRVMLEVAPKNARLEISIIAVKG